MHHTTFGVCFAVNFVFETNCSTNVAQTKERLLGVENRPSAASKSLCGL